MIPDMAHLQTSDTTAYTTSGSVFVYEALSRVGDIETLAMKTYFEPYLQAYQTIQNSQNRLEEVRSLVNKLGNLQTIERLHRAAQTYFGCKAGTRSRTDTGNEMRNLLCGIKGDLFALARKWPNENMTWEEMTSRLAKGGKGSDGFHIIIKQGELHSSLLNRLADVLKDREGGAITNIEYIWTEVLDHIYTTLTLIKAPE
jgi:hypothetical protein